MERPQLRMFRPTLADLPTLLPPDGYAFRHFRDGDEDAWHRVLCDSFGRDEDAFQFDTMMRQSPLFLPERILFATKDDMPVATASAWRIPDLMPDTGTIHWVGTHPDHSGHRLGKWVSLAALHRMRDEGLDRATLLTDDNRMAALHTYLALGFEPALVHENQRERWRKIFSDLDRPELATRYADILDGAVLEPHELIKNAEL
ncbi:MAG: GNAT family N-acetyltransferase [Lentisphaeria bacterium]|nr:GNAT family N-acetyltransferase [Lentisphaeria bacterium]